MRRTLALLLAALWLAAPASAYTLNSAQLDNGTCGRNLQVGSVKTASASATPSFLVTGDGGLSRYQVSIDGTDVGQFASNGYGNVCVTTTAPLADGPHQLTGVELAPNPANIIVPFAFTVDTVPPASPSLPILSAYSDSAPTGDHVTRFRGVNYTGTADPGLSVQLFAGTRLVSGALVNAAGGWSMTTVSLADGAYQVKAVALDGAGNKSAASPLAASLTVDGTAPAATLTPANGATVTGTVTVNAAVTDNLAVARVAFKLDGVATATVTASPYSYSWNTASVANGVHTLTATATDTAGNTTVVTSVVTVQAGAAVPGAPVLVDAVAGNASVVLDWRAPAADGGSAVTGYRVWRGTGATKTLVAQPAGLTYTDGAAANGTTYSYQVSAVTAVGEGARSNEIAATPSVPCVPIVQRAAHRARARRK